MSHCATLPRGAQPSPAHRSSSRSLPSLGPLSPLRGWVSSSLSLALALHLGQPVLGRGRATGRRQRALYGREGGEPSPQARRGVPVLPGGTAAPVLCAQLPLSASG